MKTIITNEHGTILAVAMSTIAATAVLVGLAASMTTHTLRISDRSQDMAILQAAAEGALEHGYAAFMGKLAQQNRALKGSELLVDVAGGITSPIFKNASPAPGEALKISACDALGAPIDAAANVVPTLISVAGYPGWRGRGYAYLASVKLQSTNSLANKADDVLKFGVKRFFYYTEVPLFQTMYFYEHDMDLYSSAKMNVNGLLHSNGSMLMTQTSSNPVIYSGRLSFVGGFPTPNNSLPNGPTFPHKVDINNSTYSASNTMQMPTFTNSFAAQTTKVSRLEPFGQDPSLVLDAPPAVTAANTSPSGQLLVPDGDSDGNPNNDSMHELIERPDTSSATFTDPPEIAKRRLNAKAGIIVSINGTTKTVTVQNGTTLTPAEIAAIQGAFTNTTMVDKREQKTVRVSDFNMATALSALNGAADFNGLIYIEDVTPTTTSAPLNAVRLTNGGVLPANGLTVASPSGVYIKGDYNTGATSTTTAASVPANGGNSNNDKSPTLGTYTRKPAAVIGDAVMFLSNGWDDANAGLGLDKRNATNTTYNTAVLAGFMPGGYTPAAGAQYGFSGGINNYPRFLEDWSGKYMTYFGSMVELFTSTNFTGGWSLGSVYKPPTRCFNYDTNFDAKSPPGTLDAIATSRGAWARY